jgi:hypothetical protein
VVSGRSSGRNCTVSDRGKVHKGREKKGVNKRISRVGQNCMYAPHLTVYLVISLPKTPYILPTPYICAFDHP